jgi:hypothetical protein
MAFKTVLSAARVVASSRTVLRAGMVTVVMGVPTDDG